MALCSVLRCLLLLFCLSGFRPISSKSFNECKRDFNALVLEVLPGGGWDNLRNMDAGHVMNINYSECRTTEDGVYLLPDQVFTVPLKSSRVEIHSEVLSNWLDYKSSTAYSINMEASGFSVLNGKFSVENERMKQYQAKESSVTSRTEVRNQKYIVKALPSFTLDPVFKTRVIEIANALENNQNRLAKYLSETLVLDYGTHVVTSVDAGALLAQEDYLQSSFVMSTQKSSITALASASFFGMVEFGVNYRANDSLQEKYMTNTTYSLAVSHGGMPFYPGITLKTWQESITNNLVAIDRSGLPLQFFLNFDTLPDVPKPTLLKLSKAVSQAIDLYYKINTHKGCTDTSSKNYNYQANVNDKSCEGLAENLNFGGVFQVCTSRDMAGVELCKSLNQKNPMTGAMTCSLPYQDTLLRTEEREFSVSEIQCGSHCHDCWLFFTCCHNACNRVYTAHKVMVKTYWCSLGNFNQSESSGFLFGGLYGPNLINPVTNTRSCPETFLPTTFLSDGLKICLGSDYEMGAPFSVAFGGLFSCESGNPLASGLFRCPNGYTQHLAGVSDGCEILYCVRSGIFSHKNLAPIHLPPFTRPPIPKQNITDTVVVVTGSGTTWVKNGKGWNKSNMEEALKHWEFSVGSGSSSSRGIPRMALVIIFSLLIRFL